MSSKTLLVARREFLENLRTKAFWIGIFMVPIMLVAAIVVPILLAKTKDVRHYAVIDESGWLLPEIEKRAEIPDYGSILARVAEDQAHVVKELDPVRAELQKFGDDMKPLLAKIGLDPEKMQKVAKDAGVDGTDVEATKKEMRKLGVQLEELERPEGTPALQAKGVAGEMIARLAQLGAFLKQWWSQLPKDKAADFNQNSSRGLYVRVPVEGSGDALINDLNDRLQREQLFAYFVINKDPVSGTEGCKYVSTNLTDEDLNRWFSRLASEIVRGKRLEQEGIAPDRADWLNQRVDFTPRKLSKAGTEEKVEDVDEIRQWAPVAFVYLLWIAIFSVMQMLLTNTIEEKSNRILEVLLSSISPLQLMRGKILGIAATGLTMVVSWVISFVLIARFVPMLFDKPPSFDPWTIAGDPLYLTSFLVYFTLGYLLFACLFVGIGSVCNSLKEAQNLQMPVSILLMVPLFAMVPISKDPSGRLATFLSWFPPFTPFVMMNRAAKPPSLEVYIGTTVLLVVSILVVQWAAAKIFRIGVLMTGKPPTLREMLRWIKAPVGQVPVRNA